MKKYNRQKSNRNSPKSKNSSKEVKGPSLKSTKPDSDRAYFKSSKPKLPKETEEESEKEKFMKIYGMMMKRMTYGRSKINRKDTVKKDKMVNNQLKTIKVWFRFWKQNARPLPKDWEKGST